MKKFSVLLFALLMLATQASRAQTNSEPRAGEAVLTPATKAPTGMGSSKQASRNKLEIRNVNLFDIIYWVYPDALPMFDEVPLSDTNYDLTIQGTNANLGDYWISLEKTLHSQFHIVAIKEKQAIEFYELTAKGGRPKGLEESKPGDKRSRATTSKGYQFTAMSMDGLEDALNKMLPLPVYNETGLTNSYNFLLDDRSLLSADVAIKSVQSLGLGLEKVKKEKPVLVIKKEPPK